MSESTIETSLLMERDIARQFKKEIDTLHFEWKCTPNISLPETGDALEVTLQYQCAFTFLNHTYEVLGQKVYHYEKPVLKELPDFNSDDSEDYEEQDYDGYDDGYDYDEE